MDAKRKRPNITNKRPVEVNSKNTQCLYSCKLNIPNRKNAAPTNPIKSDFSFRVNQLNSAKKNVKSTNTLSNPPMKKPTENTNTATLIRELNTLMKQFYVVTENKNFIFNMIHQLQQNYKDMLKKNEEQEERIESLKEENRKLFEEKRTAASSQETAKLKDTLQSCESKLSTLQTNVGKILANYDKSSDKSFLEQENEKLMKINSFLKFHLKQALRGFEKYKNVALNVESLYQELNEKCKFYANMLREKTKDVNDLMKTTINKIHTGTSEETMDIEEIKEKHRSLLEQQRILELKWKLFEETDIKQLQDTIIQNERHLEYELQKFTSLIKHTLSKESCSKTSTSYSKLISSRAQLDIHPKLQTSTSVESVYNIQNYTEIISVILEENDEIMMPEKELEMQQEDLSRLDYAVPLERLDVEIPISEEKEVANHNMTENSHSSLQSYRIVIDDEYELECVCETCDENIF